MIVIRRPDASRRDTECSVLEPGKQSCIGSGIPAADPRPTGANNMDKFSPRRAVGDGLVTRDVVGTSDATRPIIPPRHVSAPP